MKTKTKKGIYKASLLLIPTAIIVAILFLYFYQRIAFRDEIVVGILIIFGIMLISLILIVLTKVILKSIDGKKKIKRIVPVIHAFFSLIFIGFIIVGSMATSLQASAINYNTGPILTWGSDQDPSEEITVMWRTSKLESSLITYGTSASKIDTKETISESTNWHQVALKNLIPNTKYYYKFGNSNDIHSFTTAPTEDNASFSFLLFADPRQNSGEANLLVQPNIAKQMINDMDKQGIQPAFTIVCGDISAQATNNATWKSWFDDISADSGLASEAALQNAVGNHERFENCDGNIYGKLYPYESKPEFYYSFNYSSIHVQCLDPWNYTSCNWDGFSQKQLDWAEQDLNRSSAMKYKIVCMHPPPVIKGTVQSKYTPLVELCNEYGVDAVFFGHTHRFETAYINGIYYNLIGTGGNNGSPMGYVQVDVTPSNFKMTMRWLNGTEVNLGTVLA
jgi:predicted phosphodiesterase